jgi:hypothetical protein
MSQYDVIFDKCPYSTYSLTTSDFRTLLNLRPRYHTLPFFFKMQGPWPCRSDCAGGSKEDLESGVGSEGSPRGCHW